MGPKMVPKRGPKSDQKMVHKIIPNGPKNGQDFCPIFVQIIPKNRSDPNFLAMFQGVNRPTWNPGAKMAQRRPKIASNSLR